MTILLATIVPLCYASRTRPDNQAAMGLALWARFQPAELHTMPTYYGAV
jgi:hypothetical protein